MPHASKGIGRFTGDHRSFAMASHQAARMTILIFAAIMLVVFARVSFAQGQATMPNFQLVPGVVVDLTKDAVYVMGPQGNVVAVDISDGKEVWHSDAAAKPLAVSGDMVVSQAEPEGATNKLKIVSLNSEEAGRTVFEQTIDLPPKVNVSLTQPFGRSFRVASEIVGNEAAISWEYVERPLKGVRLDGADGESERSRDLQRTGEEEQRSGAFRLNLRSGAVSQERSVPRATFTLPTVRAIELSADAKLAGVPKPQFLSADGRYVMHPERVGTGASDGKYVWTIYDRNTGVRLGEFRIRVGYAPFFVTGDLVVYQIGRSERLTSAGLVQEPIQIRAVDLKTGQIAWSQEIRDLAERGPVPQ